MHLSCTPVAWLLVGVVLLAVGIAMTVVQSYNAEVWVTNVIGPALGMPPESAQHHKEEPIDFLVAGCLTLGVLLTVLLCYDFVRGRGQASKPFFARKKRGDYHPPEYYEKGNEKLGS